MDDIERIDRLERHAALKEDLTAGVLHNGVVNTTTTVPAFVASAPCELIQASLVTWGPENVAASDTSYWQVVLRRNPGGNWITSKTTRTDGEPITSRQAWTFDTVEFNANAALDKDNVVDFVFFKYGAPAWLTGPLLLQVRWVPR